MRIRLLSPVPLIFLGLMVCMSPGSQAYVEKLQSLSYSQFQNGWGSHPEPEWYRAAALYQAGQHESLVAVLEQMLTTGEADEVLIRRNLAVVLKDLGNYERAIQEYEVVVRRASDPRDLLELGWARQRVGRHSDALDAFIAAVHDLPSDPWAHYGMAQAYEALDMLHEALESYARAVLLDDQFAPAHYHLGLLRDRLGDYDGARTAYDRALKLDPSYTELYLYLARLHDRAGNVELAWRYYRGAALRYPQDEEPKRAVERMSKQHEAFLKGIEEKENAARLAAVRHRTVQPAPARPGVPTVRVGLAEKQSEVRFSSGGAFKILSLAGVELGHGQGREVWRAKTSSQGVQLIDSSGQVRAQAKDGVQIVQVDPTQTFILYDMVFGSGYYFATIEHRQYRGDLELLHRSDGLTVVNRVNLEEYLYSVVPSEMYATMPMEALKVQAMAARTYTLRSMGRYQSRGFDVLGSVASSEYRGVDREHVNTTQAVNETWGLVLRHRGGLIDAVYSATSGGHSASGEEVWGGVTAYLQGKLDADDPGAPEFPLTPAALSGWVTGLPEVYGSTSTFGIRSTFRWVQPVPAVRLQQIVDGRADIGQIVKIIPRERSVGGHVSRIEFIGTKGTYEVTGDRIRSTLGGIKSNLFRIETTYGPDGVPVEFLIIGGGSGHSVGLSQLGAAGRARAGQSAQEIVTHYYGDVTVHKEY